MMLGRSIIIDCEDCFNFGFVFCNDVSDGLIFGQTLSFMFEVVVGEKVEFRFILKKSSEFAESLHWRVNVGLFAKARVSEDEGTVLLRGFLWVVIHGHKYIFNDEKYKEVNI